MKVNMQFAGYKAGLTKPYLFGVSPVIFCRRRTTCAFKGIPSENFVTYVER